MAKDWVVLEDKRRYDKRWVKIEDTVNKRQYSSYFKLTDQDSDILAKFKASVLQHRAEIAKKALSKLDLTNFESGL